jgi:CRISPR-associated protein Csm4
MKTFRIELELVSPLLTPLDSDTVFGHLCWLHRWLWGERDLEETLLARYDQAPSLVVSAGFPWGCLPRPCLPRLSPEQQVSLARRVGDGSLQRGLDLVKRAAKEPFLPREWFTRPWDEAAVVERLAKRLASQEAKRPARQEEQAETAPSRLLPHNTIDRLSGTTLKEGGFFSRVPVAEAGSRWDLYLRSGLERYDRQGVELVFRLLGEQGFGQDKSGGAGRFRVLAVTEVELPARGEAALALSSFAPGPGLGEGFYRLVHKVGRLGGDWSLGGGVPFKYPLTLLAPGSVFLVEEPAAFYGAPLGQVHPQRPQVRQQSWMLPWMLDFTPEERQRWEA